MARRRAFVPDGVTESLLEGRLAPSFFGSLGNWFSSEYKNVKEDLGITKRPRADQTNNTDQQNSLLKITEPNKTTGVLPFHGTQFVHTK